MNTYFGNFTDGEKRLIESAFRGWIISRPNVPGPQFQAERGLYRARWGGKTYFSAYTISGLVQLGLAAPGDKTGEIVPPRTTADIAGPNEDEDVTFWPESIAFEGDRARRTLLEKSGR